MTRSQSAKASYFSAGLMRASASLRTSSLMAFLATWRAMLPLMVASPALMRSPEMSLSNTLYPASEQTWAMPLPICPAPITPTVWMFAMTVLFREGEVLRCSQKARKTPLIPWSTAQFAQLCSQFRERLVKIGDEAVVGDLKNRRFFVLVDCDDHLGIFHAGQMLNGA